MLDLFEPPSEGPDEWLKKHPFCGKLNETPNTELVSQYGEIVLRCCAPLLWFKTSGRPKEVLHAGTVTVVRTPARIFGITVEHVIAQYEAECKKDESTLQLGNAFFEARVIDRNVSKDRRNPHQPRVIHP